MQDYQLRVVEEKAGLDDKIVKLTSFLATEKFMELAKEDRNLLTDQLFVMHRYAEVLRDRLILFSQREREKAGAAAVIEANKIIAGSVSAIRASSQEALLRMICPRRDELGDPGGIFKLPDSDYWQDDFGSTCSYCGSIHPAAFMERVMAGAELTPTDKNYKAYIGGQKFYFQHLSDEQKQRFVALLNAHKINIGTPGRFYVQPFFIGVIDDAEGEIQQP